MSVMHRIYRDPETGKIMRQIGGQDPTEIDETFAKILNLDIASIPFSQQEKEKKVICPNCGNAVQDTPFCTECGAKLGIVCPNCGSVAGKARFCPECGTKLDDPCGSE